ncbi:60 kDa SS-A/Ro ribonucleoprotein isoform X1 [Megalobrama amblycephala]|uniref:60 kDa SS-A/Ro ribonucleoprotein isoform X1 n=2 Tax=Megalobrama amblycephala TaxID=75352 RepID=UPI0020147B5C|nr:60 kDa SS-A/Ro ribonucleoprotein isoform X1 [Megalobrama amblycephala]XP_048019893.1 60 kDa SS-A/Ro ribonucleoprotein isoform X1 [Megalobrama amblycephala]
MDPASLPEQLSVVNEQVLNSSDRSVTSAVCLRRFLCYGSESATYSTKEYPLGIENALSLMQFIEGGRGCEVVEEVRRLNLEGRAVRPNPSLFALAVCSQHADCKTRKASLGALKELCRVPVQLFTFVQYKKELKKGSGMWGRALRRAVTDWYNSQDGMSLAQAVTKCKHRAGWSHQDLLRLSHMKPTNATVALVCKYITKGWKGVQEAYGDKEISEDLQKVFAYLEAVEKAKHSTDEQELVHLIEEQRLEKEQVLTNHLKSKEVWKALLKEMPVVVLLKHLGKLTADNVLAPGSPDVAAVCERIQDETALKKAKTQPFNILVASENYKRGHGKRSKLKWEPDGDIVQALDCAFCKTISMVEPTGKRFLVAVDVSSSLSSVTHGSSISTVAVAAAMCMVIAQTELNAQIVVFSEGGVVPCTVSSDMTLMQVAAQLIQTPGGSTDCALPIIWASENEKTVDVFIIFTNNHTLGRKNPADTLKTYRQKSGVFSKLIVCGMIANSLSIADPEDRGMLDICGFDSQAVDVIRSFALDAI